VIDVELAAEELAPLLVGAVLSDGGITVRLTEVEAYSGRDDPASHAWRGPRPAIAALFGDPGTLYCYRSHGLHICGNLVCGEPGGGSAVLFRAGEVVSGLSEARRRRPGVVDAGLARGPGNLGRVFGWTLADCGRSIVQGATPDAPSPHPAALSLQAGSPVPVVSGPRVGVSVAYRRPWRFWADGDPTVSAFRRSPRIVEGTLDW
jgi:DNA-3-methyladenine glycosylase